VEVHINQGIVDIKLLRLLKHPVEGLYPKKDKAVVVKTIFIF